MLVRRFKVSDIRDYEYEHGVNVLDYLKQINISGLLELTSLGNGRCSIENAADILDKYLDSGGSIESGVLEIKEGLIGKGENEDGDNDDNTLMDITELKSLTELYDKYCDIMMSYDISYGDFWSMSTNNISGVFRSMVVKMQNKINYDLRIAHTNSILTAKAVWGKADKKAPQVDFEKENREYDNMDEAQVLMLAKLQAKAGTINATMFNGNGGK